MATHPDWGPDQREMMTAEVRCVARAVAAAQQSDVGLVMNAALPGWTEVDAAGFTRGAIVASEDYFLYRLRRDRLLETAREANCATERDTAAQAGSDPAAERR
jgi:hypothetical protein